MHKQQYGLLNLKIFFVMTADHVQLLRDFWKIAGRNERLAEDSFCKKASINLFLKLWHQSDSYVTTPKIQPSD